MKKVCRKLRNHAGESITETLASLLIIVLAMTMLAGSIVSASKVNRRVEDADTAFGTEKENKTTHVMEDNLTSSDATVTIKLEDGSSKEVSVKVSMTKDDNKYVYYEDAESTTAVSGE